MVFWLGLTGRFGRGSLLEAFPIDNLFAGFMTAAQIQLRSLPSSKKGVTDQMKFSPNSAVYFID
jgi:hypothetical protein